MGPNQPNARDHNQPGDASYKTAPSRQALCAKAPVHRLIADWFHVFTVARGNSEEHGRFRPFLRTV